MEEDDIKRFALSFYEAIFSTQETVEIDDVVYSIGRSSTRLKKVTIDDYLFIEQNPKKKSQWAEKAREGHQIMWVIKKRKYIARVMDGLYLDLRKDRND